MVKIAVAMSGGIDSSVAAALLKKQGFDIFGVFIKFWAPPGKKSEKWNKCCSPSAEQQARQTARAINIPFYSLDLKKEFKREVVDYFLSEYKTGRTPNPCVVCNKKIKFGLLLRKACSLGADCLATGHYARKLELRDKTEKTAYRLLRAKDKSKDQSYFLWQLSQFQLKKVLFPVGELTKKKVKELAKKLALPALTAPESQEICFIQTSLSGFFKKYLSSKPGKIIDARGKIIGQHNGLCFYTIGQRKGIGLAGGPWYVKEKDKKRNILIVSRQKKDLMKNSLLVENVNWISGRTPDKPIKAGIKIRYSPLSKPTIAQIIPIKGKKAKILLKKPLMAPAPGQSAVFYSKDEVLGGGIISYN